MIREMIWTFWQGLVNPSVAYVFMVTAYSVPEKFFLLQLEVLSLQLHN